MPFKGSKIADTRRIDASFDTLRAVIKKGGNSRSVAHLGDVNLLQLHPELYPFFKTFKTVFVTHDVNG